MNQWHRVNGDYKYGYFNMRISDKSTLLKGWIGLKRTWLGKLKLPNQGVMTWNRALTAAEVKELCHSYEFVEVN